jgi:manganese-dependent inorganic pyrophosphatase
LLSNRLCGIKIAVRTGAEPVRLGEINEETRYALNYFKAEAPRFVDKVAAEAEKVILVDHNEKQQSADDIEEVQVIEVMIITGLPTSRQRTRCIIAQNL